MPESGPFISAPGIRSGTPFGFANLYPTASALAGRKKDAVMASGTGAVAAASRRE